MVVHISFPLCYIDHRCYLLIFFKLQRLALSRDG